MALVLKDTLISHDEIEAFRKLHKILDSEEYNGM